MRARAFGRRKTWWPVSAHCLCWAVGVAAEPAAARRRSRLHTGHARKHAHANRPGLRTHNALQLHCSRASASMLGALAISGPAATPPVGLPHLVLRSMDDKLCTADGAQRCAGQAGALQQGEGQHLWPQAGQARCRHPRRGCHRGRGVRPLGGRRHQHQRQQGAPPSKRFTASAVPLAPQTRAADQSTRARQAQPPAETERGPSSGWTCVLCCAPASCAAVQPSPSACPGVAVTGREERAMALASACYRLHSQQTERCGPARPAPSACSLTQQGVRRC